MNNPQPDRHLTQQQLSQIIQAITVTATGLDKDKGVRISWPTGGAPAYLVTDDIVFVQAIETDNPYNRLREVQEFDNEACLSVVAISSGGSGYAVGDLCAVPGGFYGQVYVEATDSAGKVTELSINLTGYGYAVGNNVPVTGGYGSGLAINILAVEDGASVTQQTTYTRVWEVRMVIVGPSSLDNARLIRSSLFFQNIHDVLAGGNPYGGVLFLMPAIEAPVRVPELFQGNWWERCDFKYKLYESVIENMVIDTVASLEVKVYNEDSPSISQPAIDVTISAP